MAEHRPAPQTACLLCGVIMAERNLKQPYGHAERCPVRGMKHLPTERERQQQEADERRKAKENR